MRGVSATSVDIDHAATCCSRETSYDVPGSHAERTSPTTLMPLSSQFYDDDDVMQEHVIASISEQEFPVSYDEMIASLGDGPMRFSPRPRSMNQHLSDNNDNSSSSYSERSQVSSRQKKRCEHLKKQWESTNPEVPFSYEMYLRLQNETHFIAANRLYEEPEYVPFGLSIEELEPQLLTGVRSHILGRLMGKQILTATQPPFFIAFIADLISGSRTQVQGRTEHVLYETFAIFSQKYTHGRYN
jgi:hypothetical protein